MKGHPLRTGAIVAAAAVILVLGIVGAAGHRDPSLHVRRTAAAAAAPGAGPSSRPNIVFVLTDDLSLDLLRYMPQVQALAARGISFENYFVSDSLCCPSRSSIFTGNLPHDTGVFTNAGPDGGIGAFYAHGDQQHTFNLALQQAGYRTAMMGKYLNGYLQGPGRSPVPDTYVPPGWSEWDVAGYGYNEYDYELNLDGHLRRFGHSPRDYLTNVLARRAGSFIHSSSRRGSPFFLEVATFAPHSPYTPAPRDRSLFPGLRAPEPPNFDRLPAEAPSWLADHKPLTPGKLKRINRVFRLRVQDVQSIDTLLGRIETALEATRELQNTYVVFSSDNGLHTGEYRLMPGKLTAFDTDIHVPLVVAGPGVPAGATTTAMTENIDLAKTFTSLGGTTLPGDGHSLTALLHGKTPADWRDAVLVEHHGPDVNSVQDPDAQSPTSGNPTTYEAIRTKTFLYVEYLDGEREFYDLRSDPFELDNLAAMLSPVELAQLHAELAALENCHGGSACWAASHVATLP